MSTVDADQIEHLRRLWDQYGRVAMVVVVVVLAGLLSSHFYGAYQQRQATEAAALFAAYQQPPAGQTADALAAQLRARYPGTSYASFAALAQARQAVEAGKLDIAEQHLRWVVEHASEPTDRALARLRLARVLLDQGKPQAAQEALGKDASSASPAMSEIRGDIAHALDKVPEARRAYQEALAGLPPESGQAALIKLKLDALGQP